MKLFALLLATLPSLIYASDRNIYDLMYLPNQGTISGTSQFALSNGKFKAGPFKANINQRRFDQTLGYSISDKFLISANIHYANLDFDSQKNLGLSDPSLDARYRILENELTIDLLGGVIISTGEAETNGDSSNNKGANNFDFIGGNAINAGVQVGKNLNKTQIASQFIINRSMDQKEKVSGTTTKNDDHNNYFIEVSMLNTLSESKFLRSFISTRFIDTYQDSDTPKNTTAPMTDLRIGTALQIAYTKDLLISYGITYRKLQFDSGWNDDYHLWSANIGARYQF